MRHWSVTVEMDGEKLVTIESGFLSGKAEFTDEEAETIRDAARNLRSFIGDRQSPYSEDDWRE